jgi:hypothetical protein
MAGDHDLPTAVQVRGRDDLAVRRLPAEGLRPVEVDAEQRRHRADADGHRLLHEPSALAHAVRGVAEPERLRRDERTPLAQAVTGDGAGLEPPVSSRTRKAATLAARIAGCACSVSASVSAGPSKHSRDSAKPEAVVDLVEDRPRAREGLREIRPIPTF